VVEAVAPTVEEPAKVDSLLRQKGRLLATHGITAKKP
jgi:hypothetical protein